VDERFMGDIPRPEALSRDEGCPHPAATAGRPPTIGGVNGVNTALLRVNNWCLAPVIHAYIERVYVRNAIVARAVQTAASTASSATWAATCDQSMLDAVALRAVIAAQLTGL
jgi:hypothetical protein